MNILKEYKVKNLNLIFSYENEKLELQDFKFLINNLDFYSKNLNVEKVKNDFIFQGEIENEDLIFNKEKIDLFIKPYLPNLEIKKLNFSSQNNFSFKLKQIFKIDQLEIKSKIKLKELQVSNNLELKKIFPNMKKKIGFFDQIIDVEYKKNILNIKGAGNILFQNKKDRFDYTITKKEQNYNFISTIKINDNPLNIKLLNYKKNLDNDATIIFQGSKKVNNKTKFDLISYIEKDNKIEIKDLFFDKNFKIIDLKSAHFDFLDKKNNINKFSITKKKDNYYLNGPILNADKLIENLIDEDNSSKITEGNFKILINIDNLIIDKDYDLKNFKGDLMIKNQEIINGNLTGYFSNNKKLNFTVQSKDNQKITTLYLDEAKAIVSKYKFIKGFKGGLLDFYSTKQNGQSVSKLKIYDFKLKELPALTKLLTLASLQGIADLVSGEGISFDEFEMSFKNENNIMTINEIYAIGPAISILMDGYIEKNKLISLRGTLVPATTINKVISTIPVLGKILVGSKTGEGVFGVSFKIKGPPKDLKTTVNPIKTLTPRFITRTLEKIKKN